MGNQLRVVTSSRRLEPLVWLAVSALYSVRWWVGVFDRIRPERGGDLITEHGHDRLPTESRRNEHPR